jgi:hypothetical protein
MTAPATEAGEAGLSSAPVMEEELLTARDLDLKDIPDDDLQGITVLIGSACMKLQNVLAMVHLEALA